MKFNFPPPRRVSIELLDVKPTSFRVGWSAVSEATNYQWQVFTTDDPPVLERAVSTPSTVTEVLVDGLNRFATYRFQVVPMGVNGAGDMADITVQLGDYALIRASAGGTVTPLGWTRFPTEGGGLTLACTGLVGYVVSSVVCSPSEPGIIGGTNNLPRNTATISVTGGTTPTIDVLLAWNPPAAVPREWLGALSETGDQDEDGSLNWEEYYAGTSPTNSNSVLRVIELDVNGRRLHFSGVSGKRYVLLAAPNLTGAGFEALPGAVTAPASGTVSFDLPAAANGAFYRVRLEIE